MSSSFEISLVEESCSSILFLCLYFLPFALILSSLSCFLSSAFLALLCFSNLSFAVAFLFLVRKSLITELLSNLN